MPPISSEERPILNYPLNQTRESQAMKPAWNQTRRLSVQFPWYQQCLQIPPQNQIKQPNMLLRGVKTYCSQPSMVMGLPLLSYLQEPIPTSGLVNVPVVRSLCGWRHVRSWGQQRQALQVGDWNPANPHSKRADTLRLWGTDLGFFVVWFVAWEIRSTPAPKSDHLFCTFKKVIPYSYTVIPCYNNKCLVYSLFK